MIRLTYPDSLMGVSIRLESFIIANQHRPDDAVVDPPVDPIDYHRQPMLSTFSDLGFVVTCKADHVSDPDCISASVSLRSSIQRQSIRLFQTHGRSQLFSKAKQMLRRCFHRFLVSPILYGDRRLEDIAPTFFKWHHILQGRELTMRLSGLITRIAEHAVEEDHDIIVNQRVTLDHIFVDKAGLISRRMV